MGDGGTKAILFPMTGERGFVRVQSPMQPVLPPTNLHTIASGSADAVGLAWSASPTPGVLGYRILYGVSSGSLTSSIDVGNVTSAIVSGLTPGQTYYFAVIALTADGQSLATDATISAQPGVDPDIVPLFDASTALEPATTIDTPTALITHVADRARDRHAREANFHAYDHYLSWYWEERTIAIEIVDRVAKGGTDITFNYTTLTPLCAPEFRAFFRGINTVAEYHFNYLAPLVGPNRYSATIYFEATREPPLADRRPRGDRDQPVPPSADARAQQLLRHRDPLHRRAGHRAVGGRGPVARFLPAAGDRPGSAARPRCRINTPTSRSIASSRRRETSRRPTRSRSCSGGGCITPTLATARIRSRAIPPSPSRPASSGRSSSRAVACSAT